MYDLNKLKEMSLNALVFFDKFCKDNDLEYAIAFGTELGCVRHGGFIPWDDDVDVDMPIEDYLKLKKTWGRYIGSEYFLQTKENELFKPTLFYQLRKNGSTWIDPGCENIPMHWGIAIIDIFPIYHMPSNKIVQRIQKKLYALAVKECGYSWKHVSMHRFCHEVHRFVALIYLNMVWIISYFSRKSKIMYYPNGNAGRYELDSMWMYPAQTVDFENIKLMGHKDQDKYLKNQYNNYMTPPPESERGGHIMGIVDLNKHYTEYVNIKK